MPNVVVYVPAASWRDLAAAGDDPAVRVREHVRSWLGIESRTEHSARVSPEERETIRRGAERDQRSVSEFMRHAAKVAAENVEHEFAGASA